MINLNMMHTTAGGVLPGSCITCMCLQIIPQRPGSARLHPACNWLLTGMPHALLHAFLASCDCPWTLTLQVLQLIQAAGEGIAKERPPGPDGVRDVPEGPPPLVKCATLEPLPPERRPFVLLRSNGRRVSVDVKGGGRGTGSQRDSTASAASVKGGYRDNSVLQTQRSLGSESANADVFQYKADVPGARERAAAEAKQAAAQEEVVWVQDESASVQVRMDAAEPAVNATSEGITLRELCHVTIVPCSKPATAGYAQRSHGPMTLLWHSTLRIDVHRCIAHLPELKPACMGFTGDNWQAASF